MIKIFNVNFSHLRHFHWFIRKSTGSILDEWLWNLERFWGDEELQDSRMSWTYGSTDVGGSDWSTCPCRVSLRRTVTLDERGRLDVSVALEETTVGVGEGEPAKSLLASSSISWSWCWDRNAANRCCCISKCCFLHLIRRFWNQTFTWKLQPA